MKKRTYCMVIWKKVCCSKSKGGLGVKDLRKQNISLLVKWWWKLETQDGLWQKIVKAKYLRNKTVASVKPRISDSPSWKNLLKVKDTYFVCVEFLLRKVILLDYGMILGWKVFLGKNLIQPYLVFTCSGLYLC